MAARTAFTVGEKYSRPDVYEAVKGVRVLRTEGAWNRGYVFDQAWNATFIFANVGIPGVTGHDYANEWVGDVLVWETTSTERRDSLPVRRMLDPDRDVHVFTRSVEKAHWTYAGRAVPVPGEVRGEQPVRVQWSFEEAPGMPSIETLPVLSSLTSRRTRSAHQGYIEARLPPPSNEVERLLRWDPAKFERATQAHARTQNLLAERLVACGLQPVSPRGAADFDLGWVANDHLHLVEVKSLSRLNEAAQIRGGVGQLLDYRERIELAGVHVGRMVLAVEQRPVAEHWHALCARVGIELVFGPEFSGFP